jgi:hypothetical protein
MASGPSISLLDTRNSDQSAIDNSLSTFITKYLPGYVPGQPYSGQLSAPMDTYQNQGMQFLQKYLDQQGQPGATSVTDNAANEINTTLTGGYDPSTSPFFKATRDAAMVEKQSAQNRLNQGLGARGKYFSSEALNEGQQLETNTSNFLNQTLSGMAEKERQNRLTAAGMAPAISAAQNKAAMAPIAAATTFGAIPQEQQQADLERQYQEFQRQRNEQIGVLSAASGAYSKLGKTPVIPAKPSFDWGSFLGQVGGMALNAGMAYATGGGSVSAGALADNSGQSLASMGGVDSSFLSSFGY